LPELLRKKTLDCFEQRLTFSTFQNVLNSNQLFPMKNCSQLTYW